MINFRWLKPITTRELKFISNDVLVIHAEKILIFYNVKTQKEDILIVGEDKSIPINRDYHLPFESINCVDCCGADLLAFTEQPPLAYKVVICHYPDMKVLATLIGKYKKFNNNLDFGLV